MSVHPKALLYKEVEDLRAKLAEVERERDAHERDAKRCADAAIQHSDRANAAEARAAEAENALAGAEQRNEELRAAIYLLLTATRFDTAHQELPEAREAAIKTIARHKQTPLPDSARRVVVVDVVKKLVTPLPRRKP